MVSNAKESVLLIVITDGALGSKKEEVRTKLGSFLFSSSLFT